jgi:predicted ATPase/class 3 adenylate cyclase
VFCDLSGSTELGDRVDAELVYGLMRSYFDEVRSALERHGGTVEKFIGDAVVGMFGVPEGHEDDALRACRAALEIQERIAALNVELERLHGSGIAVRVGVNTGEVVAGESARRELFASGDAVVLGDSVNVAARLEQAASPGEVLVGEATYRLVHAGVRVEAVPPLQVKGKSAPLIAFRLLVVRAHGPLPRRVEAALVGRDSELALLEAAFEAVVDERRCRVITVVGEPGGGKSRLASELIERLVPRARAVRGGCLSYGEGITYWPIAQIVRELAGIRDDHSLAEARALLEPITASVAGGAAVTRRVGQLLGLAEGTATAEQIGEAVTRVVGAAAEELPLVVLVDDIQWAEPALLDLLATIPARVGDAAVLALCLARPELGESRPEWPVTLRLAPLGTADIDAMLNELGVPVSSRDRIAQVSAGNPLFVEELSAWVKEGGEPDELPTSLNALLGARLDRLDPDARAALERGAVEGELFHQAAIVELSDEASRSTVPGELGQLARRDLIRLAAASLVAGGIAYRFKHILVRDAAYRATTKRLRATLHERFADWLEQLAGERVGEYHEILGFHLERAYRYREELGEVDTAGRRLAVRAGHHLAAGARRASARGDYPAAATLAERALALLPGEGAERAAALRQYATAINMMGRPREARAIMEEVVERATVLGDRGLAARARNSVVGDRIFADANVELQTERAIVEEGLEVCTELRDETGLAEHARQLGLICMLQGRVGEAVDWLEQSLALAQACDDEVSYQMITRSLTSMLVGGPMPVPSAIARCEELRAANRDDRVLEAVVANSLAALNAMGGRFEEAGRFQRLAGGLLGPGDTMFAALGQSTAAYACELLGDRAGAMTALTAMWRFFGATSDGVPDRRAINAANQIAEICCDEGRWGEAEAWLARYRSFPLGDARGLLRPALEARLAAHRGDGAEALALAERAVEHAERTDELNRRARIWLALAEVREAAGRSSDAETAIAAALALYKRKGNVAAAARLRDPAVLE